MKTLDKFAMTFALISINAVGTAGIALAKHWDTTIITALSVSALSLLALLNIVILMAWRSK